MITKAVIPAAGLGTRFLPATKAMPKEMLPVVDKPVIQFVVEEAVSAGAPHILMVTGRNKNALENHFDRAFELEATLEVKGDSQKLSKVEESTDLADIHYVRQGDPLGLGHAVLKARAFVSGEPFALLLGDEIIPIEEKLLDVMIAFAEEKQASVIALLEIDEADVSKYGIAAVEGDVLEGLVRVVDFVEKPSISDAPSRYAIVGRYVLQPGVFDVLETVTPGVGQEIQLTDALSYMARNPEVAGPVYGYIYRGRRFDMGDKLSSLQATIEMALEREDIGPQLKSWISTLR